MKIKNVALLQIETVTDFKSIEIVYSTKEDLCEQAFNESCKVREHIEVMWIVIDGKQYVWDFTYSHYCFGEGHIELSEFVEHTFSNELQKEGGHAL